MGGYGSTRWNYHNRKHTTGEAYTFDLAAVSIRERMEADTSAGYLYSWTSDGKPSGSMGVHYFPEHMAIVFKMQVSRGDKSKDILQKVKLSTTELHFGGVRYWMQCPGCGKRTRTLHMPPAIPLVTNPFRCRSCWRLTYSSSQDSRKPSGKLYQLYDVFEKMDAIYSKLRRCKHGSKNYRRLCRKLDTLQGQYDSLIELSEQRNAIFRVKYRNLL